MRWTAYPGDPGITVPAKGELPCGLERLEVLVGLEEGPQRQRIHDANSEEHSKDSQAAVLVRAAGRGSRGLSGVAGPVRHTVYCTVTTTTTTMQAISTRRRGDGREGQKKAPGAGLDSKQEGNRNGCNERRLLSGPRSPAETSDARPLSLREDRRRR